MNQKSLQMKYEIRTVSGYQALIISKYYFIILLSLITIYLSLLRLAPSSFYILLIPVTLPSILRSVIKDYTKKHNNRFLGDLTQEKAFQLSIMKKKYRYTRLKHVTESASYLVMSLLICLWQINYSLSLDLNPILNKTPFFLLITGLMLRFLLVIIYQIKLPYDIIHNKL